MGWNLGVWDQLHDKWHFLLTAAFLPSDNNPIEQSSSGEKCCFFSCWLPWYWLHRTCRRTVSQHGSRLFMPTVSEIGHQIQFSCCDNDELQWRVQGVGCCLKWSEHLPVEDWCACHKRVSQTQRRFTMKSVYGNEGLCLIIPITFPSRGTKMLSNFHVSGPLMHIILFNCLNTRHNPLKFVLPFAFIIKLSVSHFYTWPW